MPSSIVVHSVDKQSEVADIMQKKNNYPTPRLYSCNPASEKIKIIN